MFNQSHEFDIHITDDPHLTVFTPEGSEETHLVRYLDPKGYIEEHLISNPAASKSFGGGSAVDCDCKYQLRINGGVTIDLEPVFKDHDSMSVKKLAMTVPLTRDAVFHNTAKSLRIPIDQEYMNAEFLVNGKQVASVKAKLLDLEDGKYVAQNRKGCEINQTLKNGEITNIFFKCPASLKESASQEGNRIQFKCDADDIDHVSGLVMALEDGMASGELENMDNHFYIINAHREALEKNQDAVPSAKVNASIHHVTSQMWANHIGKVFGGKIRKFFRGTVSSERKLAEVAKYTTLEQFQKKFDETIELIKQDQDQGSTGETFISEAEAIFNRAKEQTKKHPSFVLKGKYTLEEYKNRVPEIKKEQKEREAARKAAAKK